MHITRIELENIKSHTGSTFEFSTGTTAITGENGAGKTTLIEAVAWTLFDLLDYKKDDFVRRGAKKGSARVTFVSGLDEREYTVYRDTGTGYYVYDPALKVRIAEKKEEVCRFLWQHLGVDPGTDLDSLFRRAIGVPQGTFTSIFLETPAERKKAFDKLLKVEEYRRSSEELLRTVRYLDKQISDVSVNIARAEGELGRADVLADEHRRCAEQVASFSSSLKSLTAETAGKAAVVAGLDAQERTATAAREKRDAAVARLTHSEISLRHKEAELGQAREAAEKIETVRADAARYTEALGRLKELERERRTREEFQKQLADVEKAITSVRADQKGVQEKLESSLNAHRAIELLLPRTVEQERLEGVVEDLRNRLAHARAAQSRIHGIVDKIERLRESYRGNQTLLNEALAKAEAAGDLQRLESRDAEIVRELARLQADLERDQKFQSEVRNGLCPILSQKCLNLKEGETLESFISSQFTEVRARISTLEAEYSEVTIALRTSREAVGFSAQLAAYRTREAELKEEGQRLRAERDGLESEVKDIADIERELMTAEAQLKALDNPKAKIQFLEAEGRREFELRERIAEIERNLERLESDRRILVEQIELYAGLDQDIAETTARRDATEQAHRVFLANEAAAGSVAQREEAWTAARADYVRLEEELTAATAEFDAAAAGYDPAAHASERSALFDLEKRLVELQAMLGSAQRRESELAAEIERLAETRKALQAEFIEKERLEKVRETTEFIRSTLKDAAPLVARNYVYRVSQEANQLFREIRGNAEQSLKWTEDYGIELEEGGHWRPFVNLSGGEQMAAALSVRLALLKQLSEIRIAFFDEPTTNMDAERRENLAMQMSQIKHFDQLFVISHDDTFEGYVDNVISVESRTA